MQFRSHVLHRSSSEALPELPSPPSVTTITGLLAAAPFHFLARPLAGRTAVPISLALLLLLAGAPSSTLSASPAPTDSLSFGGALGQSAQTHRLVLLEFSTEWCGPCKWFARDLAADSTLQGALEEVVFFSCDAEKGEGVDLAKRYRVQAYPSFLLVDAEKTELDRWVGYGKPAQFIERLRTALADPLPLSGRVARFEKEPNHERATHIAGIYAARHEFADAIPYYRRALELGGPPTLYLPLIVAMGVLYPDGENGPEELRAVADSALAHAGGHMSEAQTIYTTAMRRVAEKTGDDSYRHPYLERWIEGAKRDSLYQDYDYLRLEEALYVLHDDELAAERKKATLGPDWQDDAASLNSYAWFCFEHRVDLENAEKLARRGMEIATDAKIDAMVTDTVAELCALRGDRDEALRLVQECRKLDPENDYYVKQVKRFSEEPDQEQAGVAVQEDRR